MIAYEDLKKSNEVFFKEYNQVFQQTLQSGWYILGIRFIYIILCIKIFGG